MSRKARVLGDKELLAVLRTLSREISPKVARNSLDRAIKAGGVQLGRGIHRGFERALGRPPKGTKPIAKMWHEPGKNKAMQKVLAIGDDKETSCAVSMTGDNRSDVHLVHLLERGTDSHTIAVKTKTVLSNQAKAGDGAQVFGTTVRHPGRAAKPFFEESARAEARKATNKVVDQLRRDFRRYSQPYSKLSARTKRELSEA